MSLPGGLCVRSWRSLCRGPALSLSLSLSVGARRSLCRGPALSVSGTGALSVGLAGAPRRSLLLLSVLSLSLSRGPRRSLTLSGPNGLYFSSEVCTALSCRYITWRLNFWIKTLDISSEIFFVAKISGLCRARALSVAGPGAPRRSLCQARVPHPSSSHPVGGRPAQMPSDPRAPAQIQVPPAVQLRSVCHPSHPRASHPHSRFHIPAQGSRDPSSDPRATDPSSDPHLSRARAPHKSASHLCVRGPQLRSACHPSGPRAPAQICVPPIQPGAFLFSREPQTLLFGGKRDQPPTASNSL